MPCQNAVRYCRQTNFERAAYMQPLAGAGGVGTLWVGSCTLVRPTCSEQQPHMSAWTPYRCVKLPGEVDRATARAHPIRAGGS